MSYFKIDGYPIDVVISEMPKFTADVTNFPSEKFGNFSDNIQLNPIEFSVEGIVTDTPTGAMKLDPTRDPQTGNPIPSKDAYTRLVALWLARKTISIETTFGKFDDMAVASVLPKKTPKTGKALEFTATFKQIVAVENNRTTVRVAIPNGANKTNLGSLESQEWAKAFKLEDRAIMVISFKSSERATLRKTLGEPIFTRRGRQWPYTPEFDCYVIHKGQQPDGYVTKNSGLTEVIAHPGDAYTYHPMATGTALERQHTPTGQADPRAGFAHYDPATKKWVDNDTDNAVTQTPPPANTNPADPTNPDGYMARWNKITRGQ